MNAKVLLLGLAAILSVTVAFGHEFDHKKEATNVKSQMQNIKEEKEFMKKLESRLGTKKGFPDLGKIEDAFEDDALPEMIESIEADHDKAEAENDDDLEAPRSSGKADARPGWPCSRRRWWGHCATRRRAPAFRSVAVVANKLAKRYRRSWRRRRG